MPLVDTLYGVPSAAASAIVDGGSLTMIATVIEPIGGETTVVGLDAPPAPQRAISPRSI